jgi:hypothetical protein
LKKIFSLKDTENKGKNRKGTRERKGRDNGREGQRKREREKERKREREKERKREREKERKREREKLLINS